MKYLTVNNTDSIKEYEWLDLTGDNLESGGYRHLVYKTDSNVKLVNKAECYKSI